MNPSGNHNLGMHSPNMGMLQGMPTQQMVANQQMYGIPNFQYMMQRPPPMHYVQPQVTYSSPPVLNSNYQTQMKQPPPPPKTDPPPPPPPKSEKPPPPPPPKEPYSQPAEPQDVKPPKHTLCPPIGPVSPAANQWRLPWAPGPPRVPSPMRPQQVQPHRPLVPYGLDTPWNNGPGPYPFYYNRNNNRYNPMHRPRFPGQGPKKKESQNKMGAPNGNSMGIKSEGENSGMEVVVDEKKRKPMSKWYPAKPWNRQDAEKALKVELESYNKQAKILIIRFPDPELSRDLVKSYHSCIEKVHFQVPSGPRYCFIQLTEDCDVEKTVEELSELEFGTLGKIKVEKKFEKPEEDVTPETIDPYTLYIGNLPLSISTNVVKERFPTAARVDIGFAQRMKYTRYAFIRYQTVEESIQAFLDNHNLVLDNRTLIVRFRRQKGQNMLPAQNKQISKKAKRESRKKIAQKLQIESFKKNLEQTYIKQDPGGPVKREKRDSGYEMDVKDLVGVDEEECESEEEDEKEVNCEDEAEEDDDEDDEEEEKTEPSNNKIEGKTSKVEDDDDEDDEEDLEEDIEIKKEVKEEEDDECEVKCQDDDEDEDEEDDDSSEEKVVKKPLEDDDDDDDDDDEEDV